MGRENRFKNIQTRLNEQANLCKLQSYKHVPINLNLPNKAVSKTLQSTVKIIHIKRLFHNTNHKRTNYITVSRQQVYFWNEVNCFCHVLTFHRWPRQSSILPALTIALGNYHQFYHTKPLLEI